MTIPELATLSDTEVMIAAGAAIALLVGALVGFLIGRSKDRPLVGLMLGGLLALPGLLAISLLPRKEPTYY
ncbi:MAG: hypothetical protein ABL966_01110 [Acidimicrobiales bacterium]